MASTTHGRSRRPATSGSRRGNGGGWSGRHWSRGLGPTPAPALLCPHRGWPGARPRGGIEAAARAAPLRLPWNFQGQEYSQVLGQGLAPIMRNEQALNQSTLAELDRRLQVVLDKPRPGG